MAAVSGFPREGCVPVTPHHSILFLPPTLRAVRSCSPYVRNPIDTLHLASLGRLPSEPRRVLDRIKPLSCNAGRDFAF